MKFEIIKIDVVDSTNDVAVKLLEKKSLNDGDIILANDQIHGRGHGSNKWESEPGRNLTFSICFKPCKFEAQSQFMLTQMLSLAISDVVCHLTGSKDVKIKWPNDIYIGDGKVAGMLVQNFIAGSKIDTVIAGIGLNVNQKVFKSDAPNPVSLINFTSCELDVPKVLNEVLAKVDEYYSPSPDEPLKELLNKKYLERLYKYMLLSDYKTGDILFKGKITGIDEYGRLLIIDENNQNRVFAHKEVVFC